MDKPLLDRARFFTATLPAAVVCRQTAAHVWGLNALPWRSTEDDWPVELIVQHATEIPGCVTYTEHLPPADFTHQNGVRLTTPERTALDCARHVPRLEAVAVLDQFLRRGVDHDSLLRRATGFWRLRETLSLADRGAASPRESWLRVILIDGGLPRPTTQIKVSLDADGSAYLDLGWEEYGLAVEYDGHDHHSSPEDRRRDETRRTALKHRGWRIIPVRRDTIPGHAADLVEHVANALIERGWQPGPEGMTRILSRLRAARRKPR